MAQNEKHNTHMAPTKNLIDAMNSVNLFGGKFQAQDLVCRETERREAEQKFRAAQKERERELKIQKEKRKKDEMEYSLYLKHQNSPQRNHHKSIRGRGNIMNEVSEMLPQGRGRGRWLPQEQERLHFNERQERVKSSVQQFADAHLHSNAVQKSVWAADSGIGLNNNNEDKTDFYPNDILSYPESSSTSDQYDDAECSSPWSSTSYESFPYLSANNSPLTVASPVPERFPSPSTSNPSRLASPSAFNPSCLASPSAVNPSRREVNQEVAAVPSARRNPFKKLAAKFSNADDFSLDLNDFPALPNS